MKGGGEGRGWRDEMSDRNGGGKSRRVRKGEDLTERKGGRDQDGKNEGTREVG